MSVKRYIAINLNDFHHRSKEWQGGDDKTVEIMVIGAKNMNNAKRTATTNNKNAWLIVPAYNSNNIV